MTINQMEIDCQLAISFAGGKEQIPIKRSFKMSGSGLVRTDSPEQELAEGQRKNFVAFVETISLPAYVFEGLAGSTVPNSIVGSFSEDVTMPTGFNAKSN